MALLDFTVLDDAGCGNLLYLNDHTSITKAVLVNYKSQHCFFVPTINTSLDDPGKTIHF